MRFKPVYLGFADCTVCKFHSCHTFHFPPTALAVCALQLTPDVHALACRNGLNVSNFAEDLKFRHYQRPIVHPLVLASPPTPHSPCPVLSNAEGMDGRGRYLDNIFVEWLWRSVRHEDVYLKEYVTVPALTAGLDNYFHLYNYEQPHQSLQDRTPAVVYQKGLPAVG